MLFYLGTHRPGWLPRTDVPLFVSARRLRVRKSFPRARGRWALDSGGFTELSMFGRWVTPAMQYSSEARKWSDAVGRPHFCAPQDWMCEPQMLARTGLCVSSHQQLTTSNYLLLRQLAPDLPWLPVLQGWEPADYLAHAAQYRSYGVDLRDAPLVGVGTMCRRQASDQAVDVVRALWRDGLTRLHGFGLSTLGLRRLWDLLESADSMAWSQSARRDASRARRGLARRWPCPAGVHTDTSHRSGCNNCLPGALAWRARVLRAGDFL